MSLRQENELHFRTPYVLLRIPEYMRWFDSATIGSLYRLLSSKIYRRGVSQLRFYREGTYLTELAKRYDEGKLCCYLTDDEIEEAMLLGDRRIKDLRKQLEDLKLIKFEKFRDGYIYQLGFVIQHKDEQGYEIGEEYEAHWIGKWYSWANADEKSEQMGAFRYYLTEKLGSDKKKEQILTELCKIFPGIEKNFSKILESSGTVKAPPVRTQTKVTKAPIEVNTNEDNNYVPPKEQDGLFDEQIQSELEAELNQFKGRLKGHYPISNISKDYRSMLGKGVSRDALTSMILSTVHETNRFPELPLFSKNLDFTHKNPVDELSWLWFALREDTTGAGQPANGKAAMYKEVKTAFSQSLDKYPREQIIWTLRRIARTPQARKALVANHFAIQKMLADYSGEYVTFLQNNVQVEAKVAAQDAVVKVDDTQRRDFLKEAANSLVVVRNDTKEEDTVEYWEAKLATATRQSLIEHYMSKIDEINRRNT